MGIVHGRLAPYIAFSEREAQAPLVPANGTQPSHTTSLSRKLTPIFNTVQVFLCKLSIRFLLRDVHCLG